MQITDISRLEPQNVFGWFAKICAIPHASGQTAALADAIADWAASRGLPCVRDSAGNLILRKPGSPGREHLAPVILQGHLDMVCEKAAGSLRDPAADGVLPVTDGEFVWAEGTTLGADDGIALAYILAVLEDDTLTHPPIEALLTADEEIGLLGANALDCSALQGRRLINIDAEEEGILTVGCAGGARVTAEVPVRMVPADPEMRFLRLTVSGLQGGHSGIDINKQRANAAVLLAILLNGMRLPAPYALCSFRGGTKMNVIPQQAEAVLCMDAESAEKLLRRIGAVIADLKAMCAETEPGLEISFALCAPEPLCTADGEAERVLRVLTDSPNGVRSMSPDVPDMVLTSLNLGTAELRDGRLETSYLVRSNDNAEKQALLENLRSFYEKWGGSTAFGAAYPAWEYRKDSPLRDTMARVYTEMYGKPPAIQAIHAGLECGILADRLPGADMISIGPDMEHVHTPAERLRVASAESCYQYLLAVLKNLT